MYGLTNLHLHPSVRKTSTGTIFMSSETVIGSKIWSTSADTCCRAAACIFRNNVLLKKWMPLLDQVVVDQLQGTTSISYVGNAFGAHFEGDTLASFGILDSFLQVRWIPNLYQKFMRLEYEYMYLKYMYVQYAHLKCMALKFMYLENM